MGLPRETMVFMTTVLFGIKRYALLLRHDWPIREGSEL